MRRPVAQRHHEQHDLLFKGLRDAFCTNIVLSGVPWEVWGKIAGHSNPATSKKYLGRMTDAQRAAIQVLGTTLGTTAQDSTAENA